MRRAWWVGLIALAAIFGGRPAQGRRHAPNLLEDEATKKVVRAAECTFGGQGRELGSTWFADLGPPFGVMYCIKCECLKVHKKRRIVAKVQCRNIKNECPKPSCDDPVLHPGRCCKTCPGDLYSPDTPQDLPQLMTPEEEEKDSRHFAALLTGQRDPAAIRFVLRRRSLHFSVEAAGQARLLRVLDKAGSTLQEVPLAAGGSMAGRACGAWRRLPRDYRRLLREGRLTAALLWQGETEPSLMGPIVSHTALGTEMFSALLSSDAGVATPGWGGTAAISASAGAAPSIHITVLFTGVLATEQLLDAPVVVTLEMIDKNTTILEEIRHIKKPSNEMNIVELSSPVSATDLRLLARGRLALSLRAARPGSGSGAQVALRGPALSRLACDVFHTALAAAPRSPPPPASGVACLHLNRDGELVYTIQVDELNMLESPMITLVEEANKRHTEVEDLTPYLRDGLANGSLDRMGPRLLESLYSGDLVVNVATHSDGSVIRGRLTSRPVADAQDLKGPTLMKRPDLTQPADLVGLAWISVDYECSIQWEISIAGPASSGLPVSGLELWLDMRPMLAPGAPVVSRKMGSLETPEGAILSPALLDLQRLHSGACEIVVKEPTTNTTLLHAMLKQIKIPDTCLPQYNDNEVPAVSYVPSHPNSADNSIDDSATCFHSGSFYDDGAQWTSANEPCTMCSCLHGRVRCDAYRCPPLTCGVKAMIRLGECCPTCSNSSLQDANTSSTRGCHQAGQFHPAGQSWHPYLPPEGFDTCAICTCEARTLKVQCTRVSCPPLACSEKLAYRPDKKACCRICPEQKPELVDRSTLGGGGELKDEGYQGGLVSKQNPEEVLASGGCRYPLGGPLQNGHEWHPTVHSHGEQKCVTCRCKDGEVKCDRKRCTRSICNSQLSQARRRGSGSHKSAPKAPPDECCQQHCRRYRRHQRHHRPART